MGKKGKQSYNSEFPVLDGLGLYAAPTKGDGNCLFRALSDQVFGDETHHHEIRQKVVAYVKDHGDHFAAFVGEFGETFDQYIVRLAQDGAYGGHIEIVGFADAYSRPVVIYQAETLYIVEPQTISRQEWKGSAHIAYHTWEHYSSIRKTGGPQSGPVTIDIPQLNDLQDSGSGGGASSSSVEVPPWKIDIVMRSVPDAPEEKVIEMLRVKDYDIVIEELIMQEFEEPEPNSESPDKNGQVEEKSSGADLAKDDEHSTSKDPESHMETETETQLADKKESPAASKKKPESKSARKQEAKLRRAEKKERVRVKKDKSKHTEGPSSSSSNSEQNNEQTIPGGVDPRRIIHI